MRGIMAAVAIAFVWALLFTIGVMTGWFAPWWLWILLAAPLVAASRRGGGFPRC